MIEFQLPSFHRPIENPLEATRKAGMLHWETMALKVRGQLRVARGDEEAAREDFDNAIEIFEELGSRVELGRALVLRGCDEDIRNARELFVGGGAVGELAGL